MEQQVCTHPSMPIEKALAESSEFMRASPRRPDFEEGVASFVEKRPPHFAPYTG
jgi:enoyl-CoA hydratase/carnithine racemase